MPPVKRNIYLKMKPLEEALALFQEHFALENRLATERIRTIDAVGRVLAEPICAALSSPNFHAAAMDGIAVAAEDTFGAGEKTPVELIPGVTAHSVNTGNALPVGTNAVIMIEHVNETAAGHIRIEAPAYPWQYVRKMGEDIVATELIFTRNHLVTPFCLGAMLSAGVGCVTVKKKPRLLMIPTGNELIEWREETPPLLAPGQVIETNTVVLGQMAAERGAESVRHPLIGDDVAAVKVAVQAAVQSGFDAVLVVGGSSAGSQDFARAVIAELGEVLIHGVTMMPGKPVIIGDIAGIPAFGIPGYPVSAIMVFEQFVNVMIERMLGVTTAGRPRIEAVMARKIVSGPGMEEFLRVRLGEVGPKMVATPLPKGAGSITTLTEADGITRIPKDLEGLPEGEPVTVELLRPLSAIRRTIVVVGSHDNTLKVLADRLRVRHGETGLSSSHVGSLGGLLALGKGNCHLAGAHLLDTENGTYNISYIRKYLAGIPLRLINLVFREQGLIVRRGNPKGIQGIADLMRPDVTFINRQKGSGTRILLDYQLNAIGLQPESIRGYRQEEFTHMSVAVAVLSARADVGMGIQAAARALDLDFIPIVTEEYDLVIPEASMTWSPVQQLLETIDDPRFKAEVKTLGGYHTEQTGRLMWSQA